MWHDIIIIKSLGKNNVMQTHLHERWLKLIRQLILQQWAISLLFLLLLVSVSPSLVFFWRSETFLRILVCSLTLPIHKWCHMWAIKCRHFLKVSSLVQNQFDRFALSLLVSLLYIYLLKVSLRTDFLRRILFLYFASWVVLHWGQSIATICFVVVKRQPSQKTLVVTKGGCGYREKQIVTAVVEMCFIIKVCKLHCGRVCVEEQVRGRDKVFQPDGGLQGPDNWYIYRDSDHLIIVACPLHKNTRDQDTKLIGY